MAIIQDTDRFSTDAGRFPTSAGRVHINRNTGSFIWEMDVIGTHFPANNNGSDSQPAFFQLVSTQPNKLIIDYGDGTGEHVYDFVFGSGLYRCSIHRLRNTEINGAPTPENISRTGNGYYPVYFYEDLPLPAGTVDDVYPHPRKITFKIEDFQFLETLYLYGIGIYGKIPSIITRLISLTSLRLEFLSHVNGISSSLTKVFSKTLRFRSMGFGFGDKIPDFILNSAGIISVALTNMVNLSAGPISSRLLDLISSPSYVPDLNSFDLSGTNINYRFPELKRQMDGNAVLVNMSSGFLFSNDLSKYHFASLRVTNSPIPVSEHQRLLENSWVLQYYMDGTGIDVDFDLASDNEALLSVNIGGNTFGGVVPSFLARLKAIEEVSIYTATGINDWGFQGISASLKVLTIYDGELPTTLPTWFSGLVNLQDLNLDIYDTQIAIDDHVTSFYGIAGSTVDFDGMNYTLYRTTAGNTISVRPSGTYQDPGGAPTSPMEMIWKLVNEHNMIVTVLNTAGDGKDIYT